MKQIMYILFLAFLLTNCDKKDYSWDLSRDNPLDTNSLAYIPDTVGPLDYTSYFLVCDEGDGDGIVEVGETVYIKVYLKKYWKHCG